jgi:replicative DNA helicase
VGGETDGKAPRKSWCAVTFGKDDDDAHAAGEPIPHRGKPVDPSEFGGADSSAPGETSKASDAGGPDPFELPADAIARELREALAALQSGELSEPNVLPRLEKLRAARQPRRTRGVADVSAAALALMDDRAQGKHVIPTPWADYNEQLPGGGFLPGAHLLVSGTGTRKTAAVLSIALHHAREGHPVLYVGLEIEDAQAYLRLAADLAGVRWSDLMNGTSTTAQQQAVRAVKDELNRLPIRFEPDEPTGWCVSRLRRSASEMRAEYGDEARLLVIVDFLQIIAAEPDERDDLRERIGKAAYAARHLARREQVTVLLVSSVARDAYAKVNGFDALRAAGVDAQLHESIVVERFLRNPDAIVGLGKESGEIEFSADTVTVAMTLPYDPKQATRHVVFALPKVRLGPAGWCSLVTSGHDFGDDPDHGASVVSALVQHQRDRRATRGGADKNPPSISASSASRPVQSDQRELYDRYDRD